MEEGGGRGRREEGEGGRRREMEEGGERGRREEASITFPHEQFFHEIARHKVPSPLPPSWL